MFFKVQNICPCMVSRRVEKLVRDNIPAIIVENGGMPNFRFMDDDEFLRALEEKLQEEVGEYMQEKNLDELADVFQVVVCLSEILGGGQRELEYLCDERRRERGKFDSHIFLESVDE